MKRYRIITSVILAMVMVFSTGILPIPGLNTAAYAEEGMEGDEIQNSATITRDEDTWTLENDVMRTVISFSGGAIRMTSLYNKLVDAEYLTGPGTSRLFYYNYDGSDISSNDSSWTLGDAQIADIDLYSKNWGKKLEITISRTNTQNVRVRLIFEIYNGQAGLRYQTFIKNNDTANTKTISASDIIDLNFPNNPKTIYYVTGSIHWQSTTGSLARGTRNCLTRYNEGHGWILSPENNYATSLTPGHHTAVASDPFLLINAWSGSDQVKISTNPTAVQLVLFPDEEMEYFATNIEVFEGDQWDGRLAAERHLRQRYKFNDTSRVISLNDWYSVGANRTDANIRTNMVPIMLEMGFDQLNIDAYWNMNVKNFAANEEENYHTVPATSFTSDLPGLANWVVSQGLGIGYWFSLTGGDWGKGKDLADRRITDFKKQQIENDLIGQYRSTWQQIDLGELWKTDTVTDFSHPSDSVYRKWINSRDVMNDIAHKYPDYMMQTTCEFENPVSNNQSVGLMALPDNGIAGLFWGAASPNYDPVKTMFGYYGLFPSEGMLDFWTNGQWRGNVGQFYSFLLSRHISIYNNTSTFTEISRSNFRKFNGWRKNPRIKRILNEIILPVYNGPGDNNAGPYSWMFTNEDKSKAILIAVGGVNTTAESVDLKLRWLDDGKTYLVEDISLDDDGEFHYSFNGKYTGTQLKASGFTVNLNESSSRGKAYWIQELEGTNPQVLYADHKISAYEESWDGTQLTVSVNGTPNSVAKVVVYKDNLNGIEVRDVNMDADGHGNAAFDGTTVMFNPVRLLTPAITDNAVNLEWIYNSPDITSSILERKTGDSGNWTAIADIPAGTLEYGDTAIENVQDYYYRVKIIYNGTESPYSNEVLASVPKALGQAWVDVDEDFESGAAAGWTPGSLRNVTPQGVWSVVTGGNGTKVYRLSDQPSNVQVYSYYGGANDIVTEVEADIRPISGSGFTAGFVIGEKDYNNFICVDISNGNYRIIPCTNGTFGTGTTQSSGSWALNTQRHLKVMINGSIISIYENGELKLTRDMGSPVTGRVGLSSYRASVEFDNVKIKAAAWYEANIQITSPKSGKKIARTAALSGTSQYVDDIYLYVDGEQQAVIDTEPDGAWSHSFDESAPLEPGPHTIMLIAKNEAGKITERKSLQIIATDEEIQTPVLTVASPSEGATVDNYNVAIEGTINRPSTVNVKVYNASDDLVRNADATVIDTSWSQTFGLLDGDYRAVITAEDDDFDTSANTSVSFSVYAGISIEDDFEGDSNIQSWTIKSGNWSITEEDGNHVLAQNATSGNGWILNGSSQWDDYIFEAKVNLLTGSNAGMAVKIPGFSGASPTNAYQADHYNGQARLFKRSSTGDMVTHAFTMQTGVWYDFRAEVHGNLVDFYIDDELMCSYEDAAPIINGMVGLVTSNSTAYFDDVKVYPYSRPAPTNPVQDDDANTFGWTDVPGYQSVADAVYYEYSTDNGSTWTACSEKPIQLDDEAYPAGWVQVRLKAESDLSLSAGRALKSTIAYTRAGSVPGDAVIVSIQPIEDITVRKGSTLGQVGLPSVVTAVYSDHTTAQVLVEWDTQPLDLNTVGRYQLEGTVAGTEIKAAVTVIVRQRNNSPPSTPPPAPVPEGPRPQVEDDGRVKVVLESSLDQGSNTAVSTVSTELMKEALKQAGETSGGARVVIFEIPETQGAAAYNLQLPANALSSGEEDVRIEIATPLGTIAAPGNMFNSSDLRGENIELTIGLADRSEIGEDIRQQIGDRPVIELNASVDGQAINWNNPDASVTISIDYTPTAEELKDPEHIVVWYIDGQGNVVSVPNGRYDPVSGKVIFTTTHFSKYAVAFVKKTFSDIGNYSWAKKQIEVLASRGVINGTTATTYSPGQNITRADFITLLVRALELKADFSTNFDDAKPSAHYYNALGTARALGIATGVGNNKFNPGEPISRQDMMVLVARAMKIAGKASATGTFSDIAGFNDAPEVSSHAVEGVATLVKEGIIQGNNNRLNPKGTATRAETAVIIYRIFNK